MFDEVVNIIIGVGDLFVNVVDFDFDMFLEWKYLVGVIYIIEDEYVFFLDYLFIKCKDVVII